MNICNENSECIYSKLDNSILCQCLNGASSCETPKTLNVSTSVSNETITQTIAQTTTTHSETTSTLLLINTNNSFFSKLDEQFDRVLFESNNTAYRINKKDSFNNENVIKKN